LTVTRKGDKLILEKSNRDFPVEILPVSDTVFYATLANLKVRFIRDEAGVVDRVIVIQGGRTEYAERVNGCGFDIDSLCP